MNPILIKHFTATAALEAHLLVALADGFTVTHATDASKAIVGVTEQSTTDNLSVDVVCSGHALVRAGGAINAGDTLVADAQGRAVAFDAANFAGAGEVYTAGTAMESAAEGDVITYAIAPSLIARLPA